MEMGHFWAVLASFQLSISLFIDLSVFLLSFDVSIITEVHYVAGYSRLVRFDLYAFIFSMTEVMFNSLNT
jgi:hypothetical protein